MLCQAGTEILLLVGEAGPGWLSFASNPDSRVSDVQGEDQMLSIHPLGKYNCCVGESIAQLSALVVAMLLTDSRAQRQCKVS